MSNPGDFIARKAVDGNLLNRIELLERRLRALENRPVEVRTLDELTHDMGVQRAGAFVAGDDGDPFTDDGGFTGAVMAHPPIEMANGDQATILGRNGGAPEFWLSALTGEGVFGGGAARLNRNGGTVVGLQTAWRLEAENGGETRRAHLGMYLPDGQTTPALGLILTDPEVGSEMVVNPGFESDLTGWAQQYAGTIAVVTSVFHSGAKSLCYTHNSVAKEIYSSSRIAVSSGTNYLVTAWLYQEYGYIKAVGEVRWYNASTSGTLLRTDTFLAQQAATGSWKQFEMAFTAPAGATHAEAVIRFEPSLSGVGTRAWVDDISFTEATVYASMTFEPDITLRGSGLRMANLSSLPNVNSLPLTFAYSDQVYTMRPGIGLAEIVDGLRLRKRITSAVTAAFTSSTGMSGVNTNAPSKFGTEGTILYTSTRFYRFNTAATANTNAGITAGTSTTVYPQWSPVFYAKIRTDTNIANMRLYCGLHSADPTANPAAGKWITFKYDSTGGSGLVAQSNIGLFTDTVNVGSLATETEYELEIFVDYRNLKIYYVVNGTVYESTPIGTWDTATALNPYVFLRTLANASKYISIARMVWEYD